MDYRIVAIIGDLASRLSEECDKYVCAPNIGAMPNDNTQQYVIALLVQALNEHYAVLETPALDRASIAEVYTRR